MNPQSVAVVGASESQPRSNNAVKALLASGSTEVFLVNPNRPEAYGQATFPSLAAIEQPIDAVLCLVNAEAAVTVVGEAAAANAGGVIVGAGGFAEEGPDGQARQQRMNELAAEIPVCGPNCVGIVNARSGAYLSISPEMPMRPGGVAMVTQTGNFLAGFASAANERELGISYLVSCGNEALLQVSDYLEYLIDDPDTTAICLALETLRDPAAFFAAARRAREVGKPIVAIKLGRTERARSIAQSHTGALSGEQWVYEAVLRQHGVQLAGDLSELLDDVICFDHLPREQWTQVTGLVTLTGSGGGAQLASDVFGGAEIELPALADLQPRIAEMVPGAKTINPLDFTGFLVSRGDVMGELVDAYASSSDIDTLMLQIPLVERYEDFVGAVTDAFVEKATATGLPTVLSSIDDARVGPRAARRAREGVAVVRGMTATARALGTMSRFVRERERRDGAAEAAPVESIPRPTGATVDSSAGPMLSFGAAMDLLASAGIPVSPFVVLGASDPVSTPSFEGPYVAKLADVPHRTELGAVELNVAAADLAPAVDDLRALAQAADLPADVAIQQMVEVDGEAFIGVDGSSTLGPLVLAGLGGVLVELQSQIGARRAPLDDLDVEDLLEPVARVGVFEGLRGSRPWDRDGFAEVVGAVGRLAAATPDWLASLDINPLTFTADGFVAVDALVVLR